MSVVTGLIERILPGFGGSFLEETCPSEDGLDVWELGSREGKILLRGSGPLARAAAFGWYLRETLHAHVSWCGKRVEIPAAGLPLPAGERRVIRQKYRVYMNYCTHSYSAAWWDWERWEFEIDSMALSGINMPLAITGTEAVWYDTLLELGFTDGEAREFLAGPAFFAWQWMTNLEGHGGPLPKSWIDSHRELGKKILARELEFGMCPIQQGFSGCVPNRMPEKFPEGKYLVKKTWNHIGHTTELEPLDPLFMRVGKCFLENQRRVFGAHGYYASDPFHEGVPPVDGDDYLRLVGKTVSDLYASFDPDYTWVMQAWSIRKPIATAVPKEHLLILDLRVSVPVRCEGYWGYPFVGGVLHNFGARMSSLHGDLPGMAENRFLLAKADAPSICGTGLFMEGIGQNPVFYDLGLEMLTRSDAVDVSEWLRGYVLRRYGCADEHALEAWELLREHVYVRDTDFTERGTVLCTRPCLKLRGTGPCDSFLIHYDPKLLLRVLELLRQVPGDSEGLRYDKMDVCRQLMSNYAQKLYAKVSRAFYDRDAEAFDRRTAEFLKLLDEIDRLLALRPEWTLSKWIADARAWGTTKEEKDLYEYNARLQITIWGNEEDSLLFDYAWKEWSGLIGSYHRERWARFFAMLKEKLARGEAYDEDALTVFENRIVWHASGFYEELGDWEKAWVHSTEPIPVPETPADYPETLLDRYREEIEND